jgi:hypothetical protein
MNQPLETRSVVFVLGVLLAAFLFFLAYFAFFVDVKAAAGFGLPLTAVEDAAWLHVKGGRDLAVGIMVTGALLLRDRRMLAVMVLGAIVVPINDGMQVALQTGRIGYALGVHGSAALYGAVMLALLGRSRAVHR